MILKSDSLNIILIGDWNKLYIQPEWIANNIFEKGKIEIRINGRGSDISLLYVDNGVIISPGQEKMMFSINLMDDTIIDNLCRCLNNFLQKAHTPNLIAYGLNIDFEDSDGTTFAELLDSMSDTNAIIENDYEIISTKISRMLKLKDNVINMETILDKTILKIHFNEHHENLGEITSIPNLDLGYIKNFIDNCCKILVALGYKIEGQQDD